jgi:hypothetical protein
MNTPSQLVASALKRVTETGLPRPDGLPDPHEHTDAPPELRDKLPSRAAKGPHPDLMHAPVGRPPEGGPMPDAKLDSAEAAWGFYQALEHNDEEEQQAWVNAIKAGGLDTVGLVELGLHFRAFRNGGRAAGKLIDMLKGTTPETET